VNKRKKQQQKIAKPTHPLFSPIFPTCLPAFSSMVRVGFMNISQTLIILRQHTNLCLVSQRLR